MSDAPFDAEPTRLEAIIATIEAFARLDFTARAPIGPTGDLTDAVAAGVNFLGEELSVAYGEMEHRVASRTAELERSTDELRRRVLHDELTGLANRALLVERIAHRLAESERRTAFFALLFIDLNAFKGVNDTLGHAAGDQVLGETARRISSVLRRADTAARLGGDEFVVLLDEVDSTEAAVGVAERVGDALRQPHPFPSDERTVSAAIGIALGPGSVTSPEALLDAADAAMYRAKRSGPDRCVLAEGTGVARPGEPW